MTPRDALAPQPDPVGGTASVTAWLLREVPSHCPHEDAARVCALLEERRRQGIERYGAELWTRNGRDARLDLLQELVDALGYVAQAHLQRPTLTTERDVLDVLRLVRRIAARVGVEP